MTKREAINLIDIIRMGYICDPQECGAENARELCDIFKCGDFHEACVMAMGALKSMEQRCGNCTYHDELNFHKSSLNPNDCWCSKRHIYTYADMSCTDWSEEDDK